MGRVLSDTDMASSVLQEGWFNLSKPPFSRRPPLHIPMAEQVTSICCEIHPYLTRLLQMVANGA